MKRRILGLSWFVLCCSSALAHAQVLESCPIVRSPEGKFIVKPTKKRCRPPKLVPRPMLEVTCTVAGAPAAPAANGTGLLFDTSCSTAFVLPPETATVEVAALTSTANASQCPSVLTLHTQVDDVLEQLEDLDVRIAAYLASFDQLQAELAQLQAQLDAAMLARDAADDALVDAVNTLAEQVAAADNAANELELCVLLSSKPECISQQQAADAASATAAEFRAGPLAAAQAAADAASAHFQTVFSEFSAKLAELSSGIDPLLELAAQLEATRESVQTVYEQYAALEGARGALRYSVPWNDLLFAYKQANPNATWSYRPVPISEASLAASAIISGDPSSVPALLWAELPADAAASGIEVMRRDGAVDVNIGLSLVGACPYFPDGDGAETVSLSRNQLAAHVVANVIYKYEAYVRAGFITRLKSSPHTQKVKKHAAKLDPLGPTQVARVLRATVALETYAAEALAATERHAQLHTLLEEQTRVIAAPALKVEQLQVLKRVLEAAEEEKLERVSEATEDKKLERFKKILVPVKPQLIYQTIEQSGALTFVP